MADVATDWREEYAYTLGLQAYIYGFPWVFLPQLRWQWVTQPAISEMTPYAALNHFWHAKALADATYRDGGSPNNDTMYSIAWVDVREEPVVLSHPDMGERDRKGHGQRLPRSQRSSRGPPRSCALACCVQWG